MQFNKLSNICFNNPYILLKEGCNHLAPYLVGGVLLALKSLFKDGFNTQQNHSRQ